jgi:plastocyanin
VSGSGWLRALACGALLSAVFAGGCGSSGSAGSSGSSSAAASVTGGNGSTSTSGSSLKVSTVPRYGTPSPSAPVLHGTVQIAYHNITISPDIVRVKVGTTLRWTNLDPIQHNVTAESGPQRFASHNLSQGQTFAVTFTKPGIYHYECTIHPTTMNGTIAVLR